VKSNNEEENMVHIRGYHIHNVSTVRSLGMILRARQWSWTIVKIRLYMVDNQEDDLTYSMGTTKSVICIGD
jgi:hypothetical protein